ncbi:MAG: PilW family protein [Rhodocyclaceae bacterium]|nr:PilW family protein [Rhodocyclaceae bacterium]
MRGVPTQHAGLTLIELMVSITIGIVLSLGLVSLMVNASRSLRAHDDSAQMQDNATTAMRSIIDDLRLGGFYGIGANSLDVDNLNSTYSNLSVFTSDVSNDCTATVVTTRAWVFDLQSPIEYLGPQLTAPSKYPCISAANFQSGNPVLIVRGALNGESYLSTSGTGLAARLTNLKTQLSALSGFSTRVFIQSVTSEDPQTLLFKGSQFDNLAAANKIKTMLASDNSSTPAPVFEYQTHLYQVAPCSRMTGSDCSQSSDRRAIPTLFRWELQPGTNGPQFVAVPLAEGVERFSVMFGVDGVTFNADGTIAAPPWSSTPDGIVDRFVAPTDATIPPEFWARVIAVRVAVLVRSPSIQTYSDAGRSYDLDDDGTADFTCSASAEGGTQCNYLRRVFTQVAMLRNCSGRGGFQGGTAGSTPSVNSAC